MIVKIKHVKEMELQYGTEWRNHKPTFFNPRMDGLAGRNIVVNKFFQSDPAAMRHISYQGRGWIIEPWMTKELNI